MYPEINNYYQGTKESQLLCDSAISLYPEFADAYYIKAIPYLKRGEFGTWKKLIDKAVEFDSLMFIGYRGGVQFMFLRNYEGAISDIEKLEMLMDDNDLGTIYNGEYNLQVIRALSYKGLGNAEKAMKILENHFQEYDAGLYGYYHLGVLYHEQKRYTDAIDIFLKQTARNEFADTHYYLGLAYKETGDQDNYTKSIHKAFDLYTDGKKLRGRDSFMDYPDKIYLEQIRQLIPQQ
jgi:tetratricopeptide (TPR) repeat protein